MYNFLATAGAKYGVGFWRPGSGIIHQVQQGWACLVGGRAAALMEPPPGLAQEGQGGTG